MFKVLREQLFRLLEHFIDYFAFCKRLATNTFRGERLETVHAGNLLELLERFPEPGEIQDLT